MLTVLSPQQQMELGGLPGEAIAGTIDPASEPGEDLLAERFRVNPVFVNFMQHVIGTFGREHPDLQEAARQQGSGSVGVIDLRTPEGPQGLSRHGLVRLPPQLHALHVRELMRLRVAPDADAPR